MKKFVFILIILFSSTVIAEEKKWIGNTNDNGHIIKQKRVRKSTPRSLPKPKFIPYPNVYIGDGERKKHHFGEYKIK